MGKIIVISNQKGGCGKSVTAANLGVGLARQGKRVLLIDADAQNSLTISLGITEPDKLPITLASVMANIMDDTGFDPTAGIIHHAESVDLLPANIALSNTELSLVPIMGRETVLRQYIDMVKPLYDWIIIDTSPSLGLLTLNALTAADSVLIPVTPKFLDAKGLELLLRTIVSAISDLSSTLTQALGATRDTATEMNAAAQAERQFTSATNESADAVEAVVAPVQQATQSVNNWKSAIQQFNRGTEEIKSLPGTIRQVAAQRLDGLQNSIISTKIQAAALVGVFQAVARSKLDGAVSSFNTFKATVTEGKNGLSGFATGLKNIEKSA